MFNPRSFHNSRPDGFGVLEVAGGPDHRFAPLRRTALTGELTGPLAALTLTQTFSLPPATGDAPVEVLYRFPLPGDAAVTGVRVRFGEVAVQTELREREAAAAEYKEAKRTGRQAALVTRESPDVFTLALTGVKPGEDVTVETAYVQLARAEGGGWSLRVPLTTSPRYVRADELNSRHAAGQPLALLRDPGHRFALDVTVRDAEGVTSPTHPLAVDGGRVRLRDGEVLPDRDCVLTWKPASSDRPALRAWVQPDGDATYFLALATPPAGPVPPVVPREVVLLVDHSGSMEGAKWEAADWAVERFLSGLRATDTFALGLFHNTTRWLSKRPQRATPEAVRQAVEFLTAHRDAGGTELGVALEQALGLPRGAEPSRNVLVITDAEVTDAGRLLRLVEREAGRADRRRVSVLCIDAAPNATLAAELAARGGGVSGFLTSDPAEDDVTTALDEVLADWTAPVAAGLALEVNRPGAEAAGRDAVLIAGEATGSAIDLGDLPAGRPVWAAGRVPGAASGLTFRLRTGASEVLAECRAGASAAGLKALFGADRLRRIEYVMASAAEGDELQSELHRLGTEALPEGKSVYAENRLHDAAALLKPVLVRESLAVGLPCAETAFVAVRTEPGRPVEETVVVANARPAGWSDQFLGGGSSGIRLLACAMPAPAGAFDADADTESVDSCLMTFPPPAPPARFPSKGGAMRDAGRAAAAPELRVAVAAGQHAPGHGAVLFDSAAGPGSLHDGVALTALTVRVPGGAALADELDPGLTLLVYVGDPTAPRARVRLADVVRQGGRRPLNVRRDAGQVVRLVLDDSNGAWAGGVPALQLVLSWR